MDDSFQTDRPVNQLFDPHSIPVDRHLVYPFETTIARQSHCV
jgi:hypothetical protein